MKDNLYNKFQITFPDKEKGETELPCVIGIIGDFYGNKNRSERVPFYEREFMDIQEEQFNELFRRFRPGLSITVDNKFKTIMPNTSNDLKEIKLSFHSIEDFLPGSLLQQVPELKMLHSRLNIVDNILNSPIGIREVCQEFQRFTDLFQQSNYSENKHDSTFPSPYELLVADLEDIIYVVGKFVLQNSPEQLKLENAPLDTLKLAQVVLIQIIGAMQRLLESQVNEIIQNPKYKRLEATYLGLKKLFHTSKKCDTQKKIHLRVLPATWSEIQEDLKKSATIEKTTLFNLIFNQLDTPGGEPFNIMICDFEITSLKNESPFLSTLQELSLIASASFCPFTFSGAPEIFEMNTFSQMNPMVKIETIFNSQDFIKWNQLRKREEFRFINIIVPNVLERLPHQEQIPIQPGILSVEESIAPCYQRNFYFEEKVLLEKDFLWGNAGYSLACVMLRCFSKTGWFEFIRGISQDEDGMDGTLPNVIYGPQNKLVAQYDKHQGQYRPKIALNLWVTQSLEQQLDQHGFIPISAHEKYKSGVFFSLSSVYETRSFAKNFEGMAKSRLASSLHYILCGCRFAHYIRVIGRDQIGQLYSAPMLENFLQKWLLKYKRNDKDIMTPSLYSSQYPLKDVIVKVSPSPNKVGSFQVTIDISPRCQGEMVDVSIQFLTEIQKK